MVALYGRHRVRGPGDLAVFENRQAVTAAKFINKNSLFILSLGVIRRLELKPTANKKLRIYSSPAILPISLILNEKQPPTCAMSGCN